MVTDIVLGVAVLALLIYRQLSARPVNASTLSLVVILGAVGVLQTAQFLGQNHSGALTYGLIAGSLLLAAAFRRAAGSDGQDLDPERPGLVPGQLADRLPVGGRRGRASGL